MWAAGEKRKYPYHPQHALTEVTYGSFSSKSHKLTNYHSQYVTRLSETMWTSRHFSSVKHEMWWQIDVSGVSPRRSTEMCFQGMEIQSCYVIIRAQSVRVQSQSSTQKYEENFKKYNKMKTCQRCFCRERPLEWMASRHMQTWESSGRPRLKVISSDFIYLK